MSHISSNPTLAAIQRAKAQGKTGPLSISDRIIAEAGMNVNSPGSFTNEGKNVFGADDGNTEKGWWAHTEAGTMNAEDEQKKNSAKPSMPSADVMLFGKKALDFSAMFAEKAAEAPPPPPPAPVPEAAEPGATPAPGVPSPQLQQGPWVDEDGKATGWWSKTDAGDLNKVEEIHKGGAGTFKPQFVSNLATKLDFGGMQAAEPETA